MKLLIPKSPGSGEGRMADGIGHALSGSSQNTPGPSARRVVFAAGKGLRQQTDNCGFGCHLCRFQGPNQKRLEYHMRVTHNFATNGKYDEAMWKYVVTEPGGTYRDVADA